MQFVMILMMMKVMIVSEDDGDDNDRLTLTAACACPFLKRALVLLPSVCSTLWQSMIASLGCCNFRWQAALLSKQGKATVFSCCATSALLLASSLAMSASGAVKAAR